MAFYDGGTDCDAHGPSLGSVNLTTGNSVQLTTSALTAATHTLRKTSMVLLTPALQPFLAATFA